MVASADKPSKGLPTAQEMMEKLALAEAEKADEAARRNALAEAEKKALLDKLTKPSGVSDEEALKARKTYRRACGDERAHRSSGLSLSQRALHRPRPCHQSARAGLGDDADGTAQGDVRVLGP